ncbi:MAG TPA: carboxypeptidase-like regulatory domain-containing protein, partial [Gemmatimonadaceae bacterium]|nr:carboxypeptidase-like regulatory domain-containing protein [Gemmatimonadaceae bacterium]
MMRLVRPRQLVAVLFLLVPALARGQSPSTIISGIVVDQGAGAGIPGVQVTILGTNVGATTNDQGRYTIRGAPAGGLTLRAIRIGYEETKQTLTVVPGQSNTADIRMRAAPVNLSPVV